MMRRSAVRAVAAFVISLIVAPAWAAAEKPFELKGKAGVSNFRVEVMFLEDSVKCTPALLKELKQRVMDVGLVQVATHLGEMRKASGTDASKPNEFFLVRYAAVCSSDGGMSFVNAAEDPFDNVNHYDPGRREWQCANRAGEDCAP
jgi:hypothetical protein